jgi:outer membrane immunogenic protein
MLKFIAGTLLAGIAFIPAAASAQDQTRAPFTGPRVEGIVGYDVLRSGESEDGVNTGTNSGDESIEGVAYGIAVGYDFNIGTLVVGAEAELSDSSAEQEFNETIDGTAFLGRIETGRDIYLGGRIGFTATPTTLVYVKGGYTNTSLKSSFAANANTTDFDTKVDGYRVGAGVEQMLGRNVYAKAEYRYSNYNGLRLDDDVFGDEDFDIDLDRHQVVAGIGLRF